MTLEVRPARLDDTEAISRLFRDRVEVWQRLDAQGRVEEPPYHDLSIYERWLHGGAWMSIETAAIWLSHVIKKGGMPFVAAHNEAIVGYAEVYPGKEPAPVGSHLHIGHFIAPADNVHDELMNALITVSAERKRQLTISFSSYDTDRAQAFTHYGMQPLTQITQYTLPASTGQGFYQATDHLKADAAQINGWHMLIGRTQSARMHWEGLWPDLWDALPEITARSTHRLHINASGQDAFVCFQQQLYVPRSADVYCWSPKPLTSQLIVAIRDWAYRADYRTLTFAVPESTVKLLGSEIESTPYRQTVFALDVTDT